ncbi:serine/threonine protein kinase [Asanoa ferruginea]|nr:serine/threonine protein kinase [Asanoa ferruginea]
MLADRYVLHEVIGSGGMGRVWRAEDRVLGRPVAIKEILTPPWLPADSAADRWRDSLREARAASRLCHPNVVAVLDIVRTDRPWIIMEYVPAKALHEVIDERGPFDPHEAARIGLDILAALETAHRAGVIHRDVKPQNVLLADDDRVVLTDFGLAVWADGGVTVPDQVLGSPDFVAPETARHGVSTVEGDLWSLGATLYTLVEGVSPYHRPTVVATLTALAAGPPDPMTRAGALAPVILRLLDRDPRQRADAAEARRLLEVVASEEPRTRPRGRATVIASTGGETGKRPRRWATAASDGPGKGPRELAALEPAASDGPTKRPRRWTTVDPASSGGPGKQRRWRATLVVAAALSLASAGTAAAVGQADEPAPSPVAHACLAPQARASATPIGGGAEPNALPPGWTWHDDPTGFTVAVPSTWARFPAGEAVCFRDPGGTRTLAVDRDAAPGPEQARRVIVTGTALSWFTDDAAWAGDEPLFRLAVSSYRDNS